MIFGISILLHGEFGSHHVKRIRDAGAYIFDLDGTLVNSFSNIGVAANETRDSFGYPPLAEEAVRELVGLPAARLFTDLNLDRSLEIQIIGSFRERLASRPLSSTNMYVGAIELLDWLQAQSKKLGVATNKPTALAKISLEQAGVLSYFAFVSGADPLPPKPAPDVLIACLHELGTTTAVFVGDRCEDMEAAVAAGVIPIGIAQGAHTTHDLMRAGGYLAFDSLDDFSRKLTNK
jgi:phosphoglycolate phosphatase